MDQSILIDALKNNLVEYTLVGLISSGMLVGGLYFIKSIPSKLYDLFLRFYSINIDIDNKCESYRVFNLWLNSNIKNPPILKVDGDILEEYKLKSKNADGYVTGKYGYGVPNEGNGISPGFCTTWFIWNNRIVVVNKSRKIEGTREYPLDTISIRIFFPSKDIIDLLIEDLSKYCDIRDTHITIKFWQRDYWASFKDIIKRPIGSIYLPIEQKTRILNDAKEFFKNEKWYEEKGVPYKRGYLFYGPPGCGKTSLIKSIASELKRDIYFLNICSMSSDNEVMAAFEDISKNSIVVIEDFDSVQNLNIENRDSSIVTPSNGKMVINPISLSTFLNITDGLLSSEGSIVIYTTNHKDKIDPALLRKGRMDLIEFIDLLSITEINNMVNNFYETTIDLSFIPDGFKASGANIQGLLIENRYDSDQFCKELDKFINEGSEG